MGEQNSGDALNIHSRILLVGLSNSLKIFDDVLIHGLSLQPEAIENFLYSKPSVVPR